MMAIGLLGVGACIADEGPIGRWFQAGAKFIVYSGFALFLLAVGAALFYGTIAASLGFMSLILHCL